MKIKVKLKIILYNIFFNVIREPLALASRYIQHIKYIYILRESNWRVKWKKKYVNKNENEKLWIKHQQSDDVINIGNFSMQKASKNLIRKYEKKIDLLPAKISAQPSEPTSHAYTN